MSHDPTTTGRGPWRLLVLDPDITDRKWLIATIAPDGVRPAGLADGVGVDEVTAAWVASVAGLSRPSLTPLPGALAWRVDEGGDPRCAGAACGQSSSAPAPAPGGVEADFQCNADAAANASSRRGYVSWPRLGTHPRLFIRRLRIVNQTGLVLKNTPGLKALCSFRPGNHSPILIAQNRNGSWRVPH